jgi:outer membrane receptor protein involved in Fe transport
VIQVIHYPAGDGPTRATVGAGTRGSASFSLALPLSPADAAWRQSLLADAQKRGLTGDRQAFDRRRVLYRGAGNVASGQLSVDLDSSILRQQPGSPHPVEHGVLTSRVPLDANDNPHGARNDENRTQLALGFELATGVGAWNTKLAVASTEDNNVRGFLRPDFAADGVTVNADGFQQYVRKTDVYLDSHVVTAVADQASLVWGFDDLYGRGSQHSANFEYAVRPDGRNAPDYRSRHIDEFTRVGDRRNFAGLYAEFNDTLSERWHVDAGARFNHTREVRDASHIDNSGGAPVKDQSGAQRRSDNRWSGTLGTSYRLWQARRDSVTAYANYRNMFKPAVIDFGPESEGGILQPETARSAELGFKGQHFDGRLNWNLSVFDMHFRHLVVAQSVNGLPSLTNAGSERFTGAELDGRLTLGSAWSLEATYAAHHARFDNYVQQFGDAAVQLHGKLLALSPRHLASIGFTYAPREGLSVYAMADYSGAAFLDRRNLARASAYTIFDAGVGYRTGAWEWRMDGYNLSDRRAAVAGSELGVDQLYRQPARFVQASVSYSLDAH